MSEKKEITAADFGLADNENPSLPPIDKYYYSPVLRYSASRNYEKIYSLNDLCNAYYMPQSTEYEVEYYCAHCGATYIFKGKLHHHDTFNAPIKSRSTTCLSCGNTICINI